MTSCAHRLSVQMKDKDYAILEASLSPVVITDSEQVRFFSGIHVAMLWLCMVVLIDRHMNVRCIASYCAIKEIILWRSSLVPRPLPLEETSPSRGLGTRLMVIKMVQSLVLSSDWRSYKLRLRLWGCGLWRKRYSSNMRILLLLWDTCLLCECV